MIKRARFSNFKCLRDVSITFAKPLTVLVGPNASGKTSILEGLHYLNQFGYGKYVRDIFPDIKDIEILYTRGGKGPLRWSLTLRTGNVETRVELKDKLLRQGDKYSDELSGDPNYGFDLRRTQEKPDHTGWKGIENRERNKQLFGEDIFLEFSARTLAAAAFNDEETPKLGADGANLAAVLAFMKLSQDERFSQLVDLLRSIFPIFKRLRFEKIKVPVVRKQTFQVEGVENVVEIPERRLADSLIFDFEGASDVPARMVSEGTLLTLGILTALFQAERPRVVLLDNLERGLHPKAQRELVGLLRKVLSANPELQIVATSHSPFILDELEPDEVLLTHLDENGHTVCARINEHPEFAKWEEAMSLGEIWSYVGEGWVAEKKKKEIAQ